jgi:hypothetical protein
MDDRAGYRKFGSQALVSFEVVLLLHPFPVKIVHFGHYNPSFARFSARSISRSSVFGVFLTDTRTTTTLRPTAVT